MNKLKTTLCLALLTITTASCSTQLPADFPKPPAINLCTPIIKPKVFDKSGKELSLPVLYIQFKNPDKTVSLKPLQLTATWVDCERTDTHEKTAHTLNQIQYGISSDDWNRGQAYRREVEAWAEQHGIIQ